MEQQIIKRKINCGTANDKTAKTKERQITKWRNLRHGTAKNTISARNIFPVQNGKNYKMANNKNGT